MESQSLNFHEFCEVVKHSHFLKLQLHQICHIKNKAHKYSELISSQLFCCILLSRFLRLFICIYLYGGNTAQYGFPNSTFDDVALVT